MKGSDSALAPRPENTDRLVSPSSLIKGMRAPLGTNSRKSRSRTKKGFGGIRKKPRGKILTAKVDRNSRIRIPEMRSQIEEIIS